MKLNWKTDLHIIDRFTKHSVNHKMIKCFSGWYEVRIVQLTDLNLNVEVDYYLD